MLKRLVRIFLFGTLSFAVHAQDFVDEVKTVLAPLVHKNATWATQQPVITITTHHASRSAGNIHDFYSEGDYWWPDPENPDGPYVQRDGLTNPDNFTHHREAMIAFSRIVGALASAYRLTGDESYVLHAVPHIKAWFIDPATRMNPHLRYAQAIKGRVTGRGIGIIDTIHLMEVAQGILTMKDCAAFDKSVYNGAMAWFTEYLQWLTTHPYGQEEMAARNNHGTCWVMQVAAFSRLTGNEELLQFCRKRYREVLLPGQMGGDGSFPLELKRTKPYGYSLFNLDAMAMICHILSDEHEDLWTYGTTDGRSISRGLQFMFPFVEDKTRWSHPPDVMFWQNWPVAHPSFLFGGLAFNEVKWFALWKKLSHDPQVPEVIRNLPVRNPVIWLKD